MTEYLSVSTLTKYLKAKFDRDPYLERVYLTGEISNFRRRHNHQYFAIKDEGAVIQATMWAGQFRKLDFELEEVMKVLAIGRISIYPRSGSYSINIESFLNNYNVHIYPVRSHDLASFLVVVRSNSEFLFLLK